MVERALKEGFQELSTGPGDEESSRNRAVLRFPYAHPLHVLNLARALDIRAVIPSALYFLSMYPLADIIRADHPKLVYAQEAMATALCSSLSREDFENVALMNEHRVSLMLDFCRKFLADRQPGERCTNFHNKHISPIGNTPHQHRPLLTANLPATPNPCIRGFASLASKASRSWFPRTGPLIWMQQVVRLSERDDVLCRTCRWELRQNVEMHREKIWQGLPSVVRMSTWDELVKGDLG